MRTHELCTADEPPVLGGWMAEWSTTHAEQLKSEALKVAGERATSAASSIDDLLSAHASSVRSEVRFRCTVPTHADVERDGGEVL